MEHTSNSNLTKEERRMELEQISRGKNGMLELHRLHHIAIGNKAGALPAVRANDSHERLIHEILGHEFPQGQAE
jgi:hypothetical protein